MDNIRFSVSTGIQYFAPMEMAYEDLPHLLGGKFDWCAGQFKDKHRIKQSWIPNQNILVFDFDIFGGNRDDFFSQYFCLVGTTKSHNKEKNGIVSERYRVIFPIEEFNLDADEYSSIYLAIAEKLNSDLACKDVARKWAPNPNPDFEYWFYNGLKLDWKKFIGIKPKVAYASKIPVLKDQKNEFMNSENWERMFKPREIDKGNRHMNFVRIAFWAKDMGCDYFDIETILNWLNHQIVSPLPMKEVAGIIKGIKR